jgi:hypothetical protein
MQNRNAKFYVICKAYHEIKTPICKAKEILCYTTYNTKFQRDFLEIEKKLIE